MKFERSCVLVLGNDKDVLREASCYAPRFHTEREFGYSEQKYWDYKDQFPKLQPDILESHKITLKDKVWIFAHGCPTYVCGLENYMPEQLADKLHGWGLREAGLITLKCCNVGVGNFLDEFAAALDAKEIKVGWLKAYMGFASKYQEGKDPNKFGKSRQKVTALNSPEYLQILAEKHYEEIKDQLEELKGSSRFKVKQGTYAYNVDNSKRFQVGA